MTRAELKAKIEALEQWGGSHYDSIQDALASYRAQLAALPEEPAEPKTETWNWFLQCPDEASAQRAVDKILRATEPTPGTARERRLWEALQRVFDLNEELSIDAGFLHVNSDLGNAVRSVLADTPSPDPRDAALEQVLDWLNEAAHCPYCQRSQVKPHAASCVAVTINAIIRAAREGK